MKFRANALFFVALWAFMRAHPTATFARFQRAVARTRRLLARRAPS